MNVERAANGLRVSGHGFYLEPHGRPPMGFLAHARGAPQALPERTVTSQPTLALVEALQPRLLKRSAILPAAWGQPFALGSLRLSLHPAGHVLGSAQVRCEADGLDLVYSGDLGGEGRKASRTAEKREQLTCETLVLRAQYGHPRYVFPPRDELLERVRAWVEAQLARAVLPVLVASLGTAQDVVRALADRGRTVRVHATIARACEVYARNETLRGFVPLEAKGDVLLLPPTARLDRLKLGDHAVCTLSGRVQDGGGIPLGDHAGFDDLMSYALRSGARQIVCVHGFAEELAQALREKKLNAVALREHHQLTLPGV